MLLASSEGRSWVRSHVSAKPRRNTGGEENQRRNISLVCEIRHLSNTPVNISGWKRGARQLTKKNVCAVIHLECAIVVYLKEQDRSSVLATKPKQKITRGIRIVEIFVVLDFRNLVEHELLITYPIRAYVYSNGLNKKIFSYMYSPVGRLQQIGLKG